MTKEEARHTLFNTKVYVDGKSREIQKKLFELGFKWYLDKKVEHTDKPFLYLEKDGSLSHGDDMEFFKNEKSREVSAAYILNLELDEGFKDGYILSYSNNPKCVFIYKSGGSASDLYCGITSIGTYCESTIHTTLGMNGNEDEDLLVLANEEQKSILFNEMKRHNKQWNAETKQIEKWSINLSPFEKVLGRDKDDQKWIPDFFQRHVPTSCYPYQCMGDNYKQCIPYEGNEDKLK